MPTGERCGDHVKQKEGAGKICDLRIREMEFSLHQRLYSEQDGAVNVIEQIQRGEQN